MMDFKDVEILKIMFPYMKDYDGIIMGVVGSIRGDERGLGVRLDGWKNNKPNAYSMESIGSYYGDYTIDNIPEVIEYRRLLAKRRQDKIIKILNIKKG